MLKVAATVGQKLKLLSLTRISRWYQEIFIFNAEKWRRLRRLIVAFPLTLPPPFPARPGFKFWLLSAHMSKKRLQSSRNTATVVAAAALKLLTWLIIWKRKWKERERAKGWVSWMSWSTLEPILKVLEWTLLLVQEAKNLIKIGNCWKKSIESLTIVILLSALTSELLFCCHKRRTSDANFFTWRTHLIKEALRGDYDFPLESLTAIAADNLYKSVYKCSFSNRIGLRVDQPVRKNHLASKFWFLNLKLFPFSKDSKESLVSFQLL